MKIAASIAAVVGVTLAMNGAPNHNAAFAVAPQLTPKVSPPNPLPGSFTYGYDLSNQDPASFGVAHSFQAAPSSAKSAQTVMAKLPGVIVDQAMDGFGAGNPEPRPGKYTLRGLEARVSLITAAKDIPVITLVSAPSWMKKGSPEGDAFNDPPAPRYYGTYAQLCAHIAQSLPQVKYFVVWSEVRGFRNKVTNQWNDAGYTQMYNDAYAAIKAVRPTALVGGPYALLATEPSPFYGVPSTLHGKYGYFDQGMLNLLSYWLAHKVGADFIAVDGATSIAKSDNAHLETPVQAAEQYAAVDGWIRSRSRLPIWWMESHIQPKHGWTSQQAAAARVATLAEMSASGAAVGMQWQPQDQAGFADEGLWTSTLLPGGGKPTPLAKALPTSLRILARHPTIEQGEPSGVLVARDAVGTLIVNTLDRTEVASIGGRPVRLRAGQIQVSF